jgi:hypothetical protein
VTRTIGTVVETVKFISASSLKHYAFVALLGDIESERGEILCLVVKLRMFCSCLTY